MLPLENFLAQRVPLSDEIYLLLPGDKVMAAVGYTIGRRVCQKKRRSSLGRGLEA